MYLPRTIISHLYLNLLQTHNALSPPVLILVSLDSDALCACRILTALLKRDYIQHEIKPVSGYSDLEKAGRLVRKMRTTEGNAGGVVVCLGVGGLVDLESILGLEPDEDGQGGMGGVDIWVFDARRPWNLSNVFGIQSRGVDANGEPMLTIPGVKKGEILSSFKPGTGGIICFDDGDIEEELNAERDAYCSLAEMPELGDDDAVSEDSDSGNEADDGKISSMK
jgi:cell division control protein 45